jgi:putative zincin peptidase
MMKARSSLPADFSERKIPDPSKNPKFVVGAIVMGIALLLSFGWLLVLFADALRPGPLDALRLRNLIRSTSTTTSLAIPPALFRDLLISLIAVLIAHELVHALSYWLLSGKRPKIGIQGLFPYAAAPGGAYFPRNQFLAIGLAPLVLLTAVGLLLIVIVPLPFVPSLLFFIVFNAAGAAGDLMMAIQLLSFSPDTLFEDSDAGLTIYEPPGNKDLA